MSNDNFKKSPLHDKNEIIRMMDELEPKHMAEIVERIVKLHNEIYGGYICPRTNLQCDDECCVSAEDCHINASDELINGGNK
jgi:hypothetical protein